MTLDEAIAHCKEKAKELRTEAEQLRDIGEVMSSPKQPYNKPVKNCLECANEHEQLAEWLEELKTWREGQTVYADSSLILLKKDSNNAPTVTNRSQGEWMIKSNGTTNYFVCNKCGSAGDIQDKYCRECGLKMKGGNEE